MTNTRDIIVQAQQNGILQYGASQYIAAIEQAQRDLQNNEMLLVYRTGDILHSGGNTCDAISLFRMDETTDMRKIIISNNTENLRVYLPPNLQIIGSLEEGAPVIDNYQEIEYIDFGKNIEIIGIAAFPATQCNTFVFPSTLRYIMEQAFIESQGQGIVDLPNGLTDIGPGAFADSQFQEITIPDTVINIGENAFRNVRHITYNGSATGAPWGALAMN